MTFLPLELASAVMPALKVSLVMEHFAKVQEAEGGGLFMKMETSFAQLPSLDCLWMPIPCLSGSRQIIQTI